MSLATRCAACGTVFRVVQDQLKVSEGWVRCGRCNEVFNALSGLFDLDRESPPEWEPQEREEWARPAGRDREGDEDAEETTQEPPPSDPRLVDKIDSELVRPRGAVASTPEPAPDAPSVAFGPVVRDDDSTAAPGSGIEFEPREVDAPDFVRRAERAQRWNRPWVRATLSASAAALLLLLGMQAAHHFRDELSARYPDAAPALADWCSAIGCRLGPPRHIDDVAVESTALSRAGAAEAYRLSIVLRNHGATALELPSIDLALTDAAGQLIARRALAVRDFTGAPERLAPGADANLQTVLTAGSTKITGYTVELFYP